MMPRARLPRLSITQRAALRAVMETGTGVFENLSGWHRGKYHKGARMFFTGAGAFRWSTGDALVDAGLLAVKLLRPWHGLRCSRARSLPTTPSTSTVRGKPFC
jgi:hypothetical protein